MVSTELSTRERLLDGLGRPRPTELPVEVEGVRECPERASFRQGLDIVPGCPTATLEDSRALAGVYWEGSMEGKRVWSSRSR